MDPSQLQVTDAGITGTAKVILNGDPWVHDTDWKNGGSLMGRLTLDVNFGERNDQGHYPLRGSWQLEWGISGELSGSIEATIGE